MFDINNTRRSVLAWNAIALGTWIIILILFFQAREAYIWLGTEDRLGENMTSVFYFAAGALLIARSIRQIRGRHSHILAETLPLLLGLFMIFVGGEEISWGQRLFGVATPEALREANIQSEINLHNLKFFAREGSILNQHTALNVFALLMGVVFPLAHWKLGWVRSLMVKFNFPVLPVACCTWFFLGLLHGQTLAKVYPHWSHPEVKELIFSVGFFLFGLSWYRHGRCD